MTYLLAVILACVCAVIGIVQLAQGDFLWAIFWFVLACIIGPGGYSIFRRSRV